MAGQMIHGGVPVNDAVTASFVALLHSSTEVMGSSTEGVYSPVFTVPNTGDAVLLQGYDLRSTLYIEMVQVEMLPMPHQKKHHACTCVVTCSLWPGPSELSDADTTDQSNDCGAASWALSCGANMGILTVPGTYRLRAMDADCVGEHKVYAKLIKRAAVANIPRELIFGNTQ